MREKIGASMIVGISGLALTAEEAQFLVRENIGGVILFKRNFASPRQLHELCTEIRELARQKADKSPFFISVDQEGGRVARFRSPFTEWPPMAKVGALDSATVVFRVAQLIGTELAAAGINMNFAPSVDVLTNPANTVIGDRALGTTAESVAKLASAAVRGYLKAGLIPVAKHFPGHGNTLLDSHEELPIENRSLAELEACELEPFRRVIRARLDFIMSSHILFPNIDPKWPVSLSEVFLKDILRHSLRWRGLIVSDDLDMKALTKHHSVGEIAVRALQAGTNVLLYCNEAESPRVAVDAIEKAVRDRELSTALISDNAARIIRLKTELGLGSSRDMTIRPWPEAEKLIGAAAHKQLADAVRGGSVPSSLLAM